MKKLLSVLFLVSCLGSVGHAFTWGMLRSGLSIYHEKYTSTITSQTVVIPTHTFNIIQSSGGPVVINQVGTADTIATENISPGTYVVFASTASNRDVIFVAGATQNIVLKQSPRTLSTDDIIGFMFNGINWVEVFFTDVSSEILGNLNVTGNGYFSGDITIADALTVKGSMTVSGISMFTKEVTVSSISFLNGTLFHEEPSDTTFHIIPPTGYYTSIGTNAVTSHSIGTGGLLVTDKIEVNGLAYFDQTVELARRLLLPLEDSTTGPTLAFGDGDTGFYESADDIIEFAQGGSAKWVFASNAWYSTTGDRGVYLFQTGATDTNPGFSFRGDGDTGMGTAGANQLSLIASGVEGVRISVSSVTIIHDLYANGALHMESSTIYPKWLIMSAGGYIKLVDDNEIRYGAGNDFAGGYNNANDEYRLVTGTNLSTDANVVFSANAQAPIFKSSTTVGLQGTSPLEIGEYYWNTDTNELWIATGTAINQFIVK